MDATNHRVTRWILLSFMLIALVATGLLTPASVRGQDGVRIKDIARLQGVRENQLRGFGIVVGLAGTGDGGIEFVNRSIANALDRMGIRVQDPGDADLDNIAAVMVTATLPPFKKPGDKIDVTVSSIGSASDLSGGVLVQTPLRAGNDKTYAVAQGSLTKGGDAEDRHLTTLRVPGGALVEREVPFEFVGDRQKIRLQIQRSDFTTTARVARQINRRFEARLARPLNGSTVRVNIPRRYRSNPVAFIATVENLRVSPARQNQIVVNERTGTVLMGAGVTVSPVSISHGGLTLQVGRGDDGGGEKAVNLPRATTIGKVLQSLNSVGASTQDIIAILEAMDEAGSLNAPLEVM